MPDERTYEELFREVQAQLAALLKEHELLTDQFDKMCKTNEAQTERITELCKVIELQTKQLQSKDEELARQKQILLNMQRARFGQRSEKSTYVLDDGSRQLSMFDPEENEATQQPAPAEEAAVQPETVVASHTRKKKRTLEELSADLPVEEVEIDLAEEEKMTADGRPLRCIGREYIRTELVVEHARTKVIKRYRKVYGDPLHERETGFAELRKPDIPAPLIPHSYASASLVTDVVIKKYADGMPLYRQEQAWKRVGIDLGRGTLASWVIRTADMYLSYVRDRLRERLILQGVTHADETTTQVLKEKGKPATSESRMWVYASSKRAEIQIRCFDYRDTRSGECAAEYLEGFQGVLVSDGYSGYNKVSGVTRAGCWAHARRKWFEAMPKGATPETSVAAQGYGYCNRLFALERELEDLPDAKRAEQRRLRARPILEDYRKWLSGIDRPSGKLKDAVNYSLNQWDYLCCFVEHGEIEISNNQVENAIRPFVVGRKGWLFSDTPAGAKATAIYYSIIETAKANGLNVEGYLEHLLTVLPDRFAKSKTPDIDDLLPWSETMIRAYSLTH